MRIIYAIKALGFAAAPVQVSCVGPVKIVIFIGRKNATHPSAVPTFGRSQQIDDPTLSATVSRGDL